MASKLAVLDKGSVKAKVRISISKQNMNQMTR